MTETTETTETTFAERFRDAVTLLCGGRRPPETFVTQWLECKDADFYDLQSYAIEHGPDWCQGIVLLDAAYVMAAAPEEGVNHAAASGALRLSYHVNVAVPPELSPDQTYVLGQHIGSTLADAAGSGSWVAYLGDDVTVGPKDLSVTVYVLNTLGEQA